MLMVRREHDLHSKGTTRYGGCDHENSLIVGFAAFLRNPQCTREGAAKLREVNGQI